MNRPTESNVFTTLMLMSELFLTFTLVPSPSTVEFALLQKRRETPLLAEQFPYYSVFRTTEHMPEASPLVIVRRCILPGHCRPNNCRAEGLKPLVADRTFNLTRNV